MEHKVESLKEGETQKHTSGESDLVWEDNNKLNTREQRMSIVFCTVAHKRQIA